MRNGRNDQVHLFTGSLMPLIVITVLLAPAPFGKPAPPLGIAYTRSCTQARPYEPATGTYHIHCTGHGIAEGSGFEVVSTARLSRPVVLRLTGIPERLDHPLALSVGKEYFRLDPERHDRALFHVERKGGVTTVTFTEKGKALLAPGARIHYTHMTW